jgi:hypothetical protein
VDAQGTRHVSVCRLLVWLYDVYKPTYDVRFTVAPVAWVQVRLTKVSVGLALTALFGAPAVASADVGYRGPAFKPSSVTVIKPSGQKPQSKLWFNDGTWWGDLFVPGVEEFRVHRLDPLTQTWADTGTPLDTRDSSEGDVLWDGTHLYVASGSDEAGSSDATRITILRLSYDAATRRYVRDASYQPVLPGGPIEAVVLDKDSIGRLWLTYTRNNTVFVAHTNGAPDDVWGAPYALPVTDANTLTPDDISAVVAYGGRIGVMWSNQNAQAMYFASHADGAPDSAWSLATALGGAGTYAADDHINLKSVQGGDGRVFAAVKTSRSDAPSVSPSDAQIDLLELNGGAWTPHLFGTVGDDQTRPIVLTDQLTRRLYVFATSPTNPDPGTQAIYYKETSLDAPSFAPGAGTTFMQSSAGADINDATSTKQDLSVAPQLVVLASDLTNYWHNTFALSRPAPPVPTPTPPAPPAPAVDRTAPLLTALSAKPRSFRTRRHAGRAAGTTVRFTLSEAATVRLGLERATTGRRVGGGCVRQTRANRSRRSCVRYVVIRGVLARKLAAGAARVRFDGRLGGKRVATGRYRLVLVATDAAGNASPPRRASVRILR